MSRINLTDDADAIAKKIRKAKTDPDALPSDVDGLEDRPEARNLVNIYAALNDQSVEQVLAEVGGKQFGDFKPDACRSGGGETGADLDRNVSFDGRSGRN